MTAQSAQKVTTDVTWRSRPGLSAAVRLLAYGTPIVVATVFVRLVSPTLFASMPQVPAIVVSMLGAVVISLVVSRLTMRLMPLVVLLRMTMLFPNVAPSRLKVARQATSMRAITALLESPNLTESEAAATMLSLVTALGRHDRHTRGHSERVRLFCDLLSKELDLPAHEAGRLRWAALIHDIGKLEVASRVLNKPGSLNAAEWQAIKRHPEAGAALAAPLSAWLGSWFNGIAEHHERFDGTGYPNGLYGHNISMAGRAVAVVDAFETMTAARSYKAARSTFAAREELTRCAGSHFDPAMVRAFLRIALPRLLWSVGPLAFLVNVPVLRWVGEGGVRLVDVAGATTASATSAAGLTAVAVAVGGLHPGTPAPVQAPQASSSPAAVRSAADTVARSSSHTGTGSGQGGSTRSGTTAGTTGTGTGTTPAAGSGTPTSAPSPTGTAGGTGGTGATGTGTGSTGTGSTGTGSTGGGTSTGSGGSGGGTAGAGAGGVVGGTVGAVGKTVGKTVGGVGKTVGKTVGGVGKTVGGVVSTVGTVVGGTTGSGSGSGGSDGSGSGGSGSGGSGSSGSSGGGSGSGGSGGLGSVVDKTLCNLPLGLCKNSSHGH